MNEKHGYEGLTEKADAAFEKAALDVLRQSRVFGTTIVVWNNGQIEELTPDKVDTPARTEVNATRDPPSN